MLLEKVNLPEDVRHSLETLANSMRDIKPHEQPPTELVPWILSQFPLTEGGHQAGGGNVAACLAAILRVQLTLFLTERISL